MRARDRARVERAVSEVLEGCGREVHVIWARTLPDAYGAALIWPPSEAWVILAEAQDEEELWDTVAHEAAHVWAWVLHPGCQPHGREWRRWYRAMLRDIAEIC
jgi:hypothetical protein